MSKPLGLVQILLLSTALTSQAAFAQTGAPAEPKAPAPAAEAASAEDQPAVDPAAEEQAPEEEADVSIPGGDGGEIVVRGRYTPNVLRSTPQVVTSLSAADIARTGEGDIAGALSRATGLSVVGNGFVYVRGLGDRYSLALLNGSPLPSPEPLRRVVPLDLFPTTVISSSLVQKSYSPNFPGEFGGGVINLTTTAVPQEPFLNIGGSIGANSETTNKLGYTYYGSSSDFTGFDNGARDIPPALQAFINSGRRVNDVGVNQPEIIGQIATGRNAVIQRNDDLPPNFSANLTGGTSFDVGDGVLGVIATFGYDNSWRTRDITQQDASSRDLSTTERNFESVITDNRLVVNGLLGFGLEFGENKLRWTSLFIRDTLKQARLAQGTVASSAGFTFLRQDTAWYERQLINTQVVGEFKLGELTIDVRGSYANSQREAPYELFFEYVRSNRAGDPFGSFFINRLDGQRGTATFAFSDLNENLWSGGIDASYEIAPKITATIGYAYYDTRRSSSRREFRVVAPGETPTGIALFRPDLLLGGNIADAFDYRLFENTESDPAFTAGLRVHGGYGQLQAELVPSVNINLGVRYERGREFVAPLQVFTVPTNSGASNRINRNYWLPAGTLTWEVAPDMQVRLNGSKTIARPQFRELIFQQYYDPESNTVFQGNPLLTDSILYNGELRYEWYFARDQRLSLAGFYKKIDNPIETFVSPIGDNSFTTSFANAPTANLYGAEIEAQKYIPLSGVADTGFWANRRLVLIGNYTYTKSKIKVSSGDSVSVFGTVTQPATNFFRDGAPLTGQSDHLVNVQIGLEDQDRLSQQTILLSYGSERVTRRGFSGQPDIVERPGFNLDFVMREGFKVFSRDLEVKFEVRNITGRRFEELQTNGTNTIFYNRYRIGTSVSLGASLKF